MEKEERRKSCVREKNLLEHISILIASALFGAIAFEKT
jgi:hypothetical protein